MWLTILKLIITPIVGSASAIITDYFKNKRDFNLKKLECDTEINLAKIQAENSQAFQQKELEEFFAKQSLEFEKLLTNKTGNKIVDALNALVRTITTYWYIIIVYSFACWYYRDNPLILDSIIMTVNYIISFWFTNRSLSKR